MELPFNLLCSGITNCGKTRFILNYIQKNYKFHRIILFCPTFKNNQTYKKHSIVDMPNFRIMPFTDLDKALKTAFETYEGTNTLFLLDDIANLHDVKAKCSELCGLAFSARHAGISVWILTQKYNGIVKDFRDNIGLLILFYNKDKRSMKDALDENNVIPEAQRDTVIDYLKAHKHSNLILRLQHPFDFQLINGD